MVLKSAAVEETILYLPMIATGRKFTNSIVTGIERIARTKRNGLSSTPQQIIDATNF
jgi:hypothetical protein